MAVRGIPRNAIRYNHLGENKINGNFSPVHQSLITVDISTHKSMASGVGDWLYPENSSTLSFFSILPAAAGLNIDADVL